MEEIIVVQESGTVSCDFDSAKKMLENQLSMYQGLVFTEETKKDAKNTVAELRKQKKAFSDKCKEIKKEYMKPLDAFLEKASELSDMFDKPIIFINEQIDAFELQRIEDKKKEIASIYAELVPEEELQKYIPLASVYNSKWENATTTAKAIREEIMTAKLDCKKSVETIKNMHSEVEDQALEMYKTNRNLSDCILYLTNYEKQKAEIVQREQERIRKEEEERIRREEREKVEAERRQAEELARAVEIAKDEAVTECVEAIREEVTQEVTESFIPSVTDEEEEPYTYTILLTSDGKEKLETFMNSVGIEFFCNR